jgi:hypothetical protein
MDKPNQQAFLALAPWLQPALPAGCGGAQPRSEHAAPAAVKQPPLLWQRRTLDVMPWPNTKALTRKSGLSQSKTPGVK